MACYRSQFSPDGGGPATALSGGGFLELLEVRARWFGAMIGGRHGGHISPVARSLLRASARLEDASEASPLEYSMW